MRIAELMGALARLARVEDRKAASRDLATLVGARSLVLLVYNDRAQALLPAVGSTKTLPGGIAWRSFLSRCLAEGVHRGQLEAPGDGVEGMQAASACSNGRMAMVFIGGDVADADLDVLSQAMELLSALLGEQQALAISRGELAAAQSEMRQYAALARALDEARAELDRTMREMALQSRRLEMANATAEQAARAKDHFLAMLGHELRNPLAPIVTVLQLLQRRGEWRPEFGIMQRQVQHMQRLVDDLLDVSRIAGGKLVLDRCVVELGDVIRSAHETAHPAIAGKGQDVDLDVAAGLLVDGDPRRLAQVFANLLTNASKYSPARTKISVGARLIGDEVVVEVRDEGIGIRADMLERVFDLFEQATGGIDRAEGGLGLGLAIVRNLVRQHGGHVRAESAGPGQGSRFEVRLPVSAKAEAGPRRPDHASTWVSGHGERVLLVDDNVDALTTLSDALRIVGYTVEVAIDGHHALKLACTFLPDVAVLDIGLPGMDGYALATAMRKALSSRPPKLVALTGYGQANEIKRAFDAGFDAHLVKPVDFPNLQSVLAGLLADQSASAANTADKTQSLPTPSPLAEGDVSQAAGSDAIGSGASVAPPVIDQPTKAGIREQQRKADEAMEIQRANTPEM